MLSNSDSNSLLAFVVICLIMTGQLTGPMSMGVTVEISSNGY